GPAGEGPGEPAAVARPALPPGRRGAARPGAVRGWPPGGEGRRPERQAAAAGRAVGGGRLFWEQHGPLRRRQGRGEGASPPHVHLLEPPVGAAADDDL